MYTKLNGVGPVDNRLSPTSSTTLSQVFFLFFIMTCDTWHVARGTWHVVWGEHSFKNFSSLAYGKCIQCSHKMHTSCPLIH